MATRLLAGTARVGLPTPPGMAMMGYGARRGGARGLGDPLFARALYLESAAPALLIECDLCLIGTTQADDVRERIRARTGLPVDHVLVGCTHTHSGPDTGLGTLVGGGELGSQERAILDAVVEAGVAARAAASPARLGAGRAQAHIGINRREEQGPLDPDVLVVRVDREDGSPLAVAYAHGCHPTALGHDNLDYSADWPGEASAAVERELPGALALFVLGAHADVDPRTRGLLDLAIPDQSVGVGFEETRALGREVGEAVAAAAHEIETRGDVAINARSTRVLLPVHGGALPPADYERHLAGLRARALEAMDLPPDAEVRTSDFYRLEQERTRGLPPDEVRERLARVRHYLRDRTAPRLAGGRVVGVEVQILRLGPVLLLGLPAECTVDVGLAWKQRAPAEHAQLVSIANGWLRYLPHARNFDGPRAHQRYEILQSTFEPDAAERLLGEAQALAAEL